jgi:hypothetical protein
LPDHTYIQVRGFSDVLNEMNVHFDYFLIIVGRTSQQNCGIYCMDNGTKASEDMYTCVLYVWFKYDQIESYRFICMYIKGSAGAAVYT